MSKIMDSFRNYRQTKKEQREIDRMQYLLQVYFNVHGDGLSPESIKRVNNFILENILLHDQREVKALQQHIVTLTNINGGIKSFEEDRKAVRERLANGEIVSLTDACIATNAIYTHKNKIEYYKYNHLGGRAKITASEEKASKITIDPSKYPYMTIIDIDDPKTKPQMVHKVKEEARRIATYFEKVNARAFAKEKRM